MMLNKLKPIEKIFIIILVALIVWLVGVFAVIRPITEKKNDTEVELTSAQQKKQQTDEKIATKPKLEQNIKTTKEKMKDNLNIFFEPTENYDVDQYIYQLTAKYLTIKSFTIADSAVVEMTPYKYVEMILSYPLGDYAKLQRLSKQIIQDGAEAEADAENSEGTAAEVPAETIEIINESIENQTVNISFEASYDNIKTFLDGIKSDGKSLVVTALSMTPKEEGSATWIGSVSIEYWSVDKYKE